METQLVETSTASGLVQYGASVQLVETGTASGETGD